MALTRHIATFYTHEQTTPADTWVITHGLGRYPAVDVYTVEDSQLQKVLPQEVVYDNENQCTVTFAYSVTGYATVV
jgi:hypothetical protein